MRSKLIIEKFLGSKNEIEQEIEVYCFNGRPKIVINIYDKRAITIYDEKLNIMEDIFGFEEEKINIEADDLIKQSIVLSKKLSKPFLFVRVDWMVVNSSVLEFSSSKALSNKDFQNVYNTFARSGRFSYTLSSPSLKGSTRKILFEELTFTPYSGFNKLLKRGNLHLGKLINIEDKNGIINN